MLSPHEEEQLRLIEQHLYQDKNLLKAANDPFGVRSRIAGGVIGFLLGMALIVIAVGVANPVLGIVLGAAGFLLALAGVSVGYVSWQRTRPGRVPSRL